MFKDRKVNSPSISKKSDVTKHLNLNIEETKVSLSTKKYKKKNFFSIIRHKLNSVLDHKNKDKLCSSQKISRPFRSKSFETLSNSFEETNFHEKISASEDSIYDRNKRGSKRSQSLRSKQAICPAELGLLPNTSVSSQTELQNNENNSLTHQEVEDKIREDKTVIHGYANSSLKNSSNLAKPNSTSSHLENTSTQHDETESIQPEIEKKESISPSKSPQQKEPLLWTCNSNSGQGEKVKTLNLKDLGVTRPSCLVVSEGECKSLAEEIRKLSKYGWYWGPLNRSEAEEKLADQLDGAFLVRDSSDVKYLLSLSFRSYGKTLHIRIEHNNGWFSFYPQPDHDSFRSLVDLVNHCMSESNSGVFCYSRPLIKGSPSFPVRFTKPVSRFMQVRSLQYLCRFVIRQYTSINHIQNLPIPPRIQGYLQESYY